MFKIVKTEFLNLTVKMFEIEAPAIAAKQKPGQFVILRLHELGERIPLTIADASPQQGTITIIVQGVGKTTCELLTMEEGDSILDLVGPLGKPTQIEKFGTCVVIGGGVGTAIAYPVAKALKQIGNKVIVIIGGRSKEYAILKEYMQEFADAVYITTDDGSAGDKGVVTDRLTSIIASSTINYVLAIGPIPMMRAVAVATLVNNRKIHTTVSLNPIMLDGTGMCGGCRVVVDGKNVFACVDGPEFDAHKVDFDMLMKKSRTYGEQEHSSECIFRNNRLNA